MSVGRSAMSLASEQAAAALRWITGFLSGSGREVSQEALVANQLKALYERMDRNEDYSLEDMNKQFARIRKMKGFDTFIRRQVLWFWTKKNEEFVSLETKFDVFDALSPYQRVFFSRLEDRDIAEISRRSELDPTEVWAYVKEAKDQKVLFNQLQRRRMKGYADVTCISDLQWIQAAPDQCFSRSRNSMKNPWELREPIKPSKYEP